MTASVMQDAVCSELTTFLKMCSINGSRVADRQLSTSFCNAVTFSSTNVFIASLIRKLMPGIASCTMISSLVGDATSRRLKVAGFSLRSTPSTTKWNLSSSSYSRLGDDFGHSWEAVFTACSLSLSRCSLEVSTEKTLKVFSSREGSGVWDACCFAVAHCCSWLRKFVERQKLRVPTSQKALVC